MNYYNTTTVPTIEPTTVELTPGDFFLSTIVPLVFTLGSMLGACIVFTMELFLYKNRISFKEDSSDDEDTSEDDDDVDKDEIEEYLTQYDEEYEALPEKDFNNEDTVREMTPFGEVIMKYDRKAEAYSYYTDVMTDLTFEILETVAKKYAIYRGGVPPPDPLTGKGKSSDSKSSLIGTCANSVCASTCVNSVCASTCANSVCASAGTCVNSVCASAGTCANSVCTDSTLTGSAPTLTDSTPTGGSGGAPPFAKFKSYNTGGRGANPNYAAADTPVLNKAIHHFRFKGKLADYELEQSKTKVNDAGTPPMDYATFKKLMEITDKMKGI